MPENTLKFTVGVMLTSFGTFWAGEGVGIDWPGDEASLAALIVLTVAWSLALRAAARPHAEGRDGVRGLWHGIVDFVVGDDIWIAVAVLVLLGVAAAAVHFGADAWWLLAAGVPVVLWVSLQRALRAAAEGVMTTAADDEWRRPIDLMVDSDAPDQIALELGRRHALYLREAQRLVLEGAVPDEGGLTAGDQSRDGALPRARSRGSRVDALAPAVAGVEESTLAALRAIVATAVAAAPTPRAAAGAPDQAPCPPAVGDDRRQHGRPQAADRAWASSSPGMRRRR